MKPEQHSGNIIKWIFFTLILLVLALPVAQQLFGFVAIRGLSGKQKAAPEPEISWTHWFNDSLQLSTDKYLNEHFGFRKILVRLYNQYQFSLFDIGRSYDVVVGKEGYLYGESYINSHYGTDFVGHDSIDTRIALMKKLQFYLAKNGTELVMVFAPGKGSFYPEYIPDYFKKRYGESGERNYDYYLKRVKEERIPHIDMQEWFLKMKDTSRYTLFPRGGIHWSWYASLLVADSLNNYMEGVLGKDLPEIKMSNALHDTVDKDDRDLERTLNLIWNLDAGNMYYPHYWVNDTAKYKPKVLTTADSFWWTLYSKALPRRMYKNHQFWYYGGQVYRPTLPKAGGSQFHLGTELRKQDVVLLMATEPKLKDFAWSFLDRAVKEIQEDVKKDSLQDAFVNKQMSDIRNSPDWLKAEEKKAQRWGISVDSMLRIDALFMFNKQKAN